MQNQDTDHRNKIEFKENQKHKLKVYKPHAKPRSC